MKSLIARAGTLKDAAKACGISPSGLSKRLSGERPWRVRELAALRRHLSRNGQAVEPGELMELAS